LGKDRGHFSVDFSEERGARIDYVPDLRKEEVEVPRREIELGPRHRESRLRWKSDLTSEISYQRANQETRSRKTDPQIAHRGRERTTSYQVLSGDRKVGDGREVAEGQAKYTVKIAVPGDYFNCKI